MTRASLALLLPLAALAACEPKGAALTEAVAAVQRSAPDPGAHRVEVATIAASSAGLMLDLPGEIAGARDALLASPTGGFVEDVRVADGDRVAKGDVLVVVDAATRDAQLEQAQAQLDQAIVERDRLKKLGEFATDQQLAGAEAQVRLATAGRDLAQVQAARARVRAPFAGVVGGLAVDPGEVAGPGQPLARLVEIDALEVSLSVSDRDVVALEAGMAATVRTAARPEPVAGTVSHIAPAADLQTRAFLVKVSVPNPDGALRPGMITRVEVQRPATEALVVPQDWLVTRLDGYGLFVVVDGKAAWRPVTLGDVVRGQVVVASGLTAGDRVVITGQQELVDGDAVLVAREGTCCTDGRPVF